MTNELTHHGVLGQKWGVRRYYNSDGSLTDAGKKRIAKKAPKLLKTVDGTRAYKNAKYRSMQLKESDAVKRATDKTEYGKAANSITEMNKKYL